MTYKELLRETAAKKEKAVNEISNAIRSSFLAKAEFERDPGMVAWLWLAKDFCEKLAEHVDEFIEQEEDIDSYTAREIGAIYMAYEDDDPGLYDLLPTEARLFD